MPKVMTVARGLAALGVEERKLAISFGRALAGGKGKPQVKATRVARKPKKKKAEEGGGEE